MELHLTLGYPMKALINLVNRISRQSMLWTKVLLELRSMEMELRIEEEEEERMRQCGPRWTLVE